MNRWLILVACGLTGVPLLGQVPDPGVIALAASNDPLPVVHLNDSRNPPAPIPPPKISTDSSATAPEVVPDNGGISDTLNTASTRPVPDTPEKNATCFARIDYLRRHNDNILATEYLRQVVTVGRMPPQDHSRAILELADSLGSQHEEAESLCWLKIWTELYPARPEFGAVAYRIGALYTRMGLPDLARDAYYLALAHTVNDGQVQSADDLKQYNRLTVGTLWSLAANEYQARQWERAAELFARYRREAASASALSMEKAAFLQADCYYQLKDANTATSLYEETLRLHPFNPLVPEARLRLYHLYVLKNAPEKARQELQALVWTVRTAFPKDESHWQRETARVLLALNEKNASVLPPLLQQSSHLPPEGKTWQEVLNHYDALVGYQAVKTQAIMDNSTDSSGKTKRPHGLPEENELLAMNRQLNQLLPPAPPASTP